jgi:hypothetical protein
MSKIDLSKVSIKVNCCAIKDEGKGLEFYSPKELSFISRAKQKEQHKTLEEKADEPII